MTVSNINNSNNLTWNLTKKYNPLITIKNNGENMFGQFKQKAIQIKCSVTKFIEHFYFKYGEASEYVFENM